MARQEIGEDLEQPRFRVFDADTQEELLKEDDRGSVVTAAKAFVEHRPGHRIEIHTWLPEVQRWGIDIALGGHGV
jgi:hypothetical protein